MENRTTWMVTIAVGVGLMLGPVLAYAADPAVKCESAKLKVAAKYSACRLGADSKGVKRGVGPDYSKCTMKFSDKWNKAESKGAGLCPTNGDESAMDVRITSDAADIATLLDGGTVASCANCGNGFIDPGEDCDFGTLNGQDCVSQGFLGGGTLTCAAGCVFDTTACISAKKLVFATSSTHDGNLGGLAGADAICQSEAQAAGLAGTFKAWLSDNSASPDTRFTHSSYPYILPSPEGIHVAANWSQLTSGSLAHGIDQNPYGATVAGWAWTGTDRYGAYSGDFFGCTGWTSVLGAGGIGSLGAFNLHWTENGGDFCSRTGWYRLYCFQQ